MRGADAARVSLGPGLGMDRSAFRALPRLQRRIPTATIPRPGSAAARVLRGACPATSPALAHPRYRNFFEPHRSDIFAGFRSCA